MVIVLSKKSRFLCGLYGVYKIKSLVLAFLENDYCGWGFLGYSSKLQFSHALTSYESFKNEVFYIGFPTSFHVYLFLNNVKMEKHK